MAGFLETQMFCFSVTFKMFRIIFSILVHILQSKMNPLVSIMVQKRHKNRLKKQKTEKYLTLKMTTFLIHVDYEVYVKTKTCP